jgi:hypothetical protein
MNLTSVNQQLTRNVSDISISTSDIKAVKDRIKQMRANGASTTTQSKRKNDSVQISSTGADLSRASSTSSGSESMVPATDVRSEEKRISSGGIDSVMARYKEAQDFLEHIESESFNSTV